MEKIEKLEQRCNYDNPTGVGAEFGYTISKLNEVIEAVNTLQVLITAINEHRAQQHNFLKRRLEKLESRKTWQQQEAELRYPDKPTQVEPDKGYDPLAGWEPVSENYARKVNALERKLEDILSGVAREYSGSAGYDMYQPLTVDEAAEKIRKLLKGQS